MRDARDRLDIQTLQAGIADHFAEHKARFRSDRLSEGIRIARIDQGRGDAEARQGMGDHIDRAAIQRRRRNDMAAGIHQGRDRQMQRSLPSGRTDRTDTAIQCRETFLQDGHGRIRYTRIDVPGPLQIEQRGGVVRIIEDI